MSVQLNPLSHLPEVVNLQIFSYFNPFELGRCHLVSREWRVLASTDALWKNLTPAIAFGKREWETYFGEVGEEPPLPRNIHQILHSPCPFWKGKQVGETHLLTLIPRAVSGHLLNLKSLGELVKAPKKGGLATQYSYCLFEVMKQYGDQPVERAYWILLTKDILPDSRKETLEQHQARLQKYPSYEIPRAIEVSTALFSEYVLSQTRLYSIDPWTFTRCEESMDDYSLAIGGFALNGLAIAHAWGDDCGLGGCRKL